MNTPSVAAAIWFPQWGEELAKLSLPAAQRQEYQRALVDYLRYSRESRQRATVPSARCFMAQAETGQRLEPPQADLWKAALNWFFRAGRKQAEAPSRDP